MDTITAICITPFGLISETEIKVDGLNITDAPVFDMVDPTKKASFDVAEKIRHFYVCQQKYSTDAIINFYPNIYATMALTHTSLWDMSARGLLSDFIWGDVLVVDVQETDNGVEIVDISKETMNKLASILEINDEYFYNYPEIK